MTGEEGTSLEEDDGEGGKLDRVFKNFKTTSYDVEDMQNAFQKRIKRIYF